MIQNKIRTKHNYYKLISAITILIIIIDQITKFFAKAITNTVILIPKVLEFTFVKNTGVAFGLFKGMQWIMIVLVILIILIIIYFIKDVKNKSLAISLSLILGGAIGNLIDRIVYSNVIDFIKISIWPVFNIADACITVGAILLIIYFIKKDNKNNKFKK